MAWVGGWEGRKAACFCACSRVHDGRLGGSQQDPLARIVTCNQRAFHKLISPAGNPGGTPSLPRQLRLGGMWCRPAALRISCFPPDCAAAPCMGCAQSSHGRAAPCTRPVGSVQRARCPRSLMRNAAGGGLVAPPGRRCSKSIQLARAPLVISSVSSAPGPSAHPFKSGLAPEAAAPPRACGTATYQLCGAHHGGQGANATLLASP